MIASTKYENLAVSAATIPTSHASAAVAAAAVASVAGSSTDSKRPYFGKCQYKTGKCFNERTLKRNGDAHSLCEEHRIKQNLIQRRSDRKYQTVHAIRRRERSQRRAVLKKQVSMAVAQQLFYEHQQQKSIGIQQLSTGHVVLNGLAPANATAAAHHGMHHSVASLAPPIQIPSKMDVGNHHHHHFASGAATSFLPSIEGLASPILSFASTSRSLGELAGVELDHKVGHDDESSASVSSEREDSQLLQQRRKKQRMAAAERVVKEEESGSPTGIDDFAPDSFLTICASADEDSDAAYANLVPIMTCMGEKEMWTEDDIDFLQGLLLA